MYNPGRDLAARYPDWRVIRRPLDGAYGVMLYRRRLIIIDSGGTRAEWDCTVAHEIVHLDRGDRCTLGDNVVDVRRELLVCRAAARRMLDIQQVAGIPLFGRHPSDLADELGVDVETLRIWVNDLDDAEQDFINGRQQARCEGAA